MTGKLYRLTYYSRNLVQDEKALAAALRDILAASERNNSAAQITGAFLVNRGCFGQILEGALPAVEATFERIQQDERHGDVHLIELQPLEMRTFGSWSMTLAAPPNDTDAMLSLAGIAPQFDPATASAESMLATLSRLVHARSNG